MGEKICLSLACERGCFCFSLVIFTYGTSQRHAHLPLASPLCALNTQANSGPLPPAHLLVSSFVSLLFGAFGRRRYFQEVTAIAHFCFLNVISRAQQTPVFRRPHFVKRFSFCCLIFPRLDLNCTCSK